MKNLKTTLVLLLAILLIVLPMTACGESEEGLLDEAITITVTVVHKDKTEKVFTIETRQPTLLGALQQEELVEGEDQSGSFYVTAVDGEVADWSVDEGWWCFTKSGTMLMTGAGTTMIDDGDCYEITYTVGY